MRPSRRQACATSAARTWAFPRKELEALLSDIESNGHTSYLEVVSESDEATLASARAAAEIQPDYLIGGTLIEPVQEIIAGTGIKFFPYVGRVVGHPCLLRGSIQEIADDARRAEALGLDGVNLLAYRYDGDVEALVMRLSPLRRCPSSPPDRSTRWRGSAPLHATVSGPSRSARPPWTASCFLKSRSRRNSSSRSRRQQD
jgi:hypothetical protein